MNTQALRDTLRPNDYYMGKKIYSISRGGIGSSIVVEFDDNTQAVI